MRCFKQNGGLRRADRALYSTRSAAATSIRGSLPQRVAAAPGPVLLPNPRRSLLHTSSSPTKIYPTYPTRLANTTPRRTANPSRHTPFVPVRYCSHRRNMCKHFGADVHTGMDVTQAREVLPTNVKPTHYNLTLEPDFEKFTYEGTVVIE
jgi:aminopeptidase 2